VPKRKCDACGENKDVKGGKVCEKGHFICMKCVWAGQWLGPRKICPLDKKPLK